MSASEKLKALDAAREGAWYSGVGLTERGQAAWSLAIALPQIVAVVEALERLHERVEMDESVGVCLSSRFESLSAGAALSTLDEALS